MKRQTVWIGLLAVLLAAVLAAPAGLALGRQDDDDDDDAAAGIAGLPVSGTIEGGTFQGTISELVFADDGGQLTVSGVLSGLAIVGDEATRITGQDFTVPVEVFVTQAIDPGAEDDGTEAADDATEDATEDADDDATEDADDDATEDVDDDATETPTAEASPVAGLTNFKMGRPGLAQSALVCDILFLDLGPIFLDVLGLEVNLSRVVLDINAVPGAGNLLGNLLCAVVGLLDGGGPLSQLVDLLNQIFGGV